MRKHNYVVGYKGEGQCVYGKDHDGKAMYVEPMTVLQAKRRLKSLTSGGGIVYKLVEIKKDDPT